MNNEVTADHSKELLGIFKLLLKSTEGSSNQDQIDGLERAALELQDIITNAKYQPRLPDMTRYLSKVDREGYDTVLGYMAKTRPEEVNNMIDAIQDVVSIRRRCATAHQHQTGWDAYVVEACIALKEAGIYSVQAFPVDIIEQVLNG